jgi:hypothetical protein
MEVIKRKICREDLISRDEVNYGKVVEPYIYINISLNQTIDDIGIFTDYDFIENISLDVDTNLIHHNLRPNYDIRAWFKTGKIITTKTNSKLIELKGYKAIDHFKPGFDIEKESYVNFQGITVKGVNRITHKTDEEITYVMDANDDGLIGTDAQKTGLRYTDTDKDTTVRYQTEGLNELNSSLSAISKEEYLLGIISTPEIKNDVFIDRGQTTVSEHHLRMSEIETLDHLINYGNGYFNVTS